MNGNQENEDYLSKYCHDLTAQASDGKLDPIIGRDQELRRVVGILMRRTKNNPVILAPAGCGKTALIEKLAQRIVDGDVPQSLANARVLSLDLGALMAGTGVRGEFEKRLNGIIEAVGKSKGEIILFIDELHMLVGAGAAAGGMDGANLLKPALARGQLRCIGATTHDEYSKYIEKDRALERRFQAVKLVEPSVDETVSILRGLRERFETHYGMDITDAALVAAAKLSNRYIQSRFQPDKSIDCIDEAFATLRVALDSKPEAIDRLTRRKLQLEVELISLKREKNAKERIESVERELEQTESKLKPLNEQYERERGKVGEIADAKLKLEQLKRKADKAQREGKLDLVADLKYYAIPDLQKRLRELEAGQAELEASLRQSGSENIVQSVVTEDVVAGVVSRWTGVPVQRLLASEAEKLLGLADRLAETVIGQPVAVESVADTVLRSRAQLGDENRPIATLLFAGLSGTGKTLLAKALAEQLFDQTNGSFFRIDMSEYREEHSVARLIGAPPGYVGYEEAGRLTEQLRRVPFSVILFDEVEKAHPKVCDTLLQLFDEGRLTDSHGRTADGRNAVFIMTSNLGSDALLTASKLADVNQARKQARKGVMSAARRFFRPEFLNRIDDVIVFDPLSTQAIEAIVKIQAEELAQRVREKQIELKLSHAALQFVARSAYSPIFGARPVKRWIERQIATPLAKLIIGGKAKEGDTVLADVVESDHSHVDDDLDDNMEEDGAEQDSMEQEEQCAKKRKKMKLQLIVQTNSPKA